MELICQAVMSIVCLHAPIGETEIAVSNIGIGHVAVVRGREWEAHLGLMYDRLERPDLSTMTKACDGKECGYYRSECSPQPLTCSYRFPGGPSGETTIRLTATTPKGLEEAKASLAVVLNRKDMTGLSLAQLKDKAP